MCWNVLDVLEGFGGCVPSQVPMADRPDALERVPLQPVEVCLLFFFKAKVCLWQAFSGNDRNCLEMYGNML